MANVLVVDDSVIMRRNLCNILTKMGHTVVAEAANGEQAYLRYKTFKPDLVTMDITMPVCSGIEALEKIMNEHPDAKIIMISALNQKHKVLEALERGAKHYIIKPIVADNIAKIVNKVLAMNDSLEISPISETALKKEPDGEEKAAVPVETAGNNSALPFTIRNIDNAFHIKISSNLNNDSLEMLSQAYSGLLFVRPLKVKLDFGLTDFLEEPLLEKLGQLVNDVLEVNGSIEITSQSQNFIQTVKNKNISGLSTLI